MLTAVEGEMDRKTVTVRDFNAPLMSVVRSLRQKLSKETQALMTH